MKPTLIVLFILFSTLSFAQEKDSSVPYFSCQIIEKPFIIKNGIESDKMELYLRCSMDDFFIKFCESGVTGESIEAYLDKGIMVDFEIREGSWDICEDDYENAQSRIGHYAVIHHILERD